MKETTTSSISFVITAIYTFTFGNAVYRVFDVDEVSSIIVFRDHITWVHMVFMVVCITMSLRFFFGNNSYVAHLFSISLSPWKRLFHLSIIIIQSLILLGSSHLIPNQTEFCRWIFWLFSIELVWYITCLLFLREATRDQEGKLNVSLLVNECANLVMAIMAVIATSLWLEYPTLMAVAFTAIFVLNTMIDLKVNLPAYMGEGAVAT